MNAQWIYVALIALFVAVGIETWIGPGSCMSNPMFADTVRAVLFLCLILALSEFLR